MSKFIRNLSLFIAGIPLLATKSISAVPNLEAAPQPVDTLDAVQLRPLNREMDNLFAGHRSHSSHSSHSSHASHYSGSSGNSTSAPVYRAPLYVEPPAPARTYTVPSPPAHAPANNFTSPPSTSLTPKPNYLLSPAPPPEPRSNPEKLKLQIMRVQIKLKNLGLFEGRVDGVFSDETRTSLAYFQELKGLPTTGLMTTATLNAMGIPAVN